MPLRGDRAATRRTRARAPSHRGAGRRADGRSISPAAGLPRRGAIAVLDGCEGKAARQGRRGCDPGRLLYGSLASTMGTTFKMSHVHTFTIRLSPIHGNVRNEFDLNGNSSNVAP